MGKKHKRYRPGDIFVSMLSLLRGDMRDVLVLAIYAAGIGLTSLVVPVAVKSLVNSVAFGSLLQPLVVLTTLVFGFLIFSGIMRLLQFVVAEVIQRRLLVRMALTLAFHLPHVEFGKYRREYGNDYVLRFMEVFFAQKTVKMLLLDGIAVVFQTIVTVTLLAFYHYFFLVFSLVLGFFTFLILWALLYSGIRSSIRESDCKYEVYGWLQDLAAHPLVFKSCRGEQFAVEKADYFTDKYLDARSRHFLVLMVQNGSFLFLQAVGSAVLLGLGGYLVIERKLTLGQLVAAELLVTVLLGSITKLGKHLENFYDLAASIVKIESLMSLPFEKIDGRYFGEFDMPAELSIKDLQINFSNEKFGLNNINLKLGRGEVVAIYGENGTGKSLIADAIYRLSEPDGGSIEIDGHSVKDIHPNELRSEVALVREVELVRGTILDNLILARKDTVNSELTHILDKVGLSEVIRSLPTGLSTMMSSFWGPLSRGQLLRLMIARAMLQKPRLLVIDGTLDGVDNDGLNMLCETLVNSSNPWTLLVFTQEEYVAEKFASRFRLVDGELQKF